MTRRAALKTALLASVFMGVTVFPSQAASISNVTSNGSVGRYEKFEIAFSVDTSAEQPFWPYDTSPPPEIPAGKGITVEARFTGPDGRTYVQPGFHYQEFDDQIKESQEWFYPTGNDRWKVRFSPHLAGGWIYTLTARDANGTASHSGSFSVSPSSQKGFLRVAANDPRYFEFKEGGYFPALGYNAGFDYTNPLVNTADFQKMQQNGVQLIRNWLGMGNPYAATWNPWKSRIRAHQTQEPKLQLAHPTSNLFSSYPGTVAPVPPQAAVGSEFYLWLKYDAGRSADDVHQAPCMVLGWTVPHVPVKSSTRYRLRVRYHDQGLVGPRVAGSPYGFVVKEGRNLWGSGRYCFDSGEGTVLAATYNPQGNEPWRNFSDNTVAGNAARGWRILESTFTTGSTQNYMDELYLALENVTGGHAYVDYVWVEEMLPGGGFGPNVVYKPWMDHHQYINQRGAYAFDKILALAEQHKVYLKMVINEKNDYILQSIAFDGSIAPRHTGGNFYGNGRTMTRVRWLQQAWWRYVQARWGYSSYIHSWELLNEGDPGSANHYALADEMGKYLKCRVFGEQPVSDANMGDVCRYDHPNAHMVTTSFWGDAFPWRFWNNSDKLYADLDYADQHYYANEDDPKDTTIFRDEALYMSLISTSSAVWAPGKRKPFIRAESGFVFAGTNPFGQNLSDGLWLHNSIWAGINHGGMMDLPWPLLSRAGTIVSRKNSPAVYDHRRKFKPYDNFIHDIPLNNGRYQDAQANVTNPDIRAWGQKDLVSGRMHLWVQNRNHTWYNVVNQPQLITPESGQITVSGFTPAAAYTVEWWDTSETDPSQQVTARETLVANVSGALVFSINNLAGDVALKVISATVSTDNPPPQAPKNLRVR